MRSTCVVKLLKEHGWTVLTLILQVLLEAWANMEKYPAGIKLQAYSKKGQPEIQYPNDPLLQKPLDVDRSKRLATLAVRLENLDLNGKDKGLFALKASKARHSLTRMPLADSRPQSQFCP